MPFGWVDGLPRCEGRSNAAGKWTAGSEVQQKLNIVEDEGFMIRSTMPYQGWAVAVD